MTEPADAAAAVKTNEDVTAMDIPQQWSDTIARCLSNGMTPKDIAEYFARKDDELDLADLAVIRTTAAEMQRAGAPE